MAGIAFISTDDGIGRLAARHVQPDPVQRRDLLAEHRAVGLGVGPGLHFLVLGIGADPRGGAFQRLALLGGDGLERRCSRACGISSSATPRRPSDRSVGVIQQRRVAARADVGDDLAHGLFDLLVGDLLPGQQGVELRVEMPRSLLSKSPDVRAFTPPLPAVAHRFGQLIDEGLDARMLHFHGGLVNHQPRADVGDVFERYQAVGLQRVAGIDHVDDQVGQADQRRQFHGAVELDDLHLLPALGKVAPRAVDVLGGDAQPARRRPRGPRPATISRQRAILRSSGSYRPSPPCSSSTSLPATPRSAAPYCT